MNFCLILWLTIFKNFNCLDFTLTSTAKDQECNEINNLPTALNRTLGNETQTGCNCQREVDAFYGMSGHLEFYSSTSAANCLYLWHILAPGGGRLTLNFTRISQFNDHGENITVSDGSTGAIIWQQSPGQYSHFVISPNNQLWITVNLGTRSNHNGNRIYFFVEYEAVYPGTEFQLLKTGNTGTILSPNYPNPYPSNIRLQIEIRVESGYAVELNIDELYLCDGDYLQIDDYAGPLLTNSEIGQKAFQSTTNCMSMTFVSGINGCEKGKFKFHYSQKSLFMQFSTVAVVVISFISFFILLLLVLVIAFRVRLSRLRLGQRTQELLALSIRLAAEESGQDRSMSRNEAASMMYPAYLPSYREALTLPATDPNENSKPPDYDELAVNENPGSNVGWRNVENVETNAPCNSNEPVNSLNESIIDTRSTAELVCNDEQGHFEH